jgi:hypothetical protein
LLTTREAHVSPLATHQLLGIEDIMCEHKLQVFSYPVDFVSAFMLCYTQDDTHTEGIERFDVISMKAIFFSTLMFEKWTVYFGFV